MMNENKGSTSGQRKTAEDKQWLKARLLHILPDFPLLGGNQRGQE